MSTISMKLREELPAAGFTVIEVLVAIVVITVALLALAGLSTFVIKSEYIGKKITSASALAQERLEHYRNIGFTNFTTGTFIEDYGTIADPAGAKTPFGGYRREISITSGPALNMRTVTVTMRRKSDNSSAVFRTIIPR